ncbi:MAG: hypothetical protein M3335_05440 [Actinomycetota bacterium]|nr:hypothetical protein [Actinomycetota bacterium]
MSRAALALGILAAGLALFGCGGSGEDGAERLAKQEELRAAREDAARDARQSAKIEELERQLKDSSKQPAGSGREKIPPPTPVDPGIAVNAEEPLAGLWKGEAVIRYDSGESDPFHQTIEIDSLTLGSVVGYSEAQQGSTTCHGPLTYEGASEGWYRFSAQERNVDECIDYSEVQLRPDSSGGLMYRETTEVSVSTGTLERIR